MTDSDYFGMLKNSSSENNNKIISDTLIISFLVRNYLQTSILMLNEFR